ncbi:MAG: hypothetical protein NWF14_00495 [Candidatus Bathyarchaeota archaeon]|nr:hypothetical protein [Candidatus Bathyarchaeota archaeon]
MSFRGKIVGYLKPRSSKEIEDSSIGVEIFNFDAIRLMAATGMKYCRHDLTWQKIEREKGVYDWSYSDRFVNELVRNGIKPQFVLCYGNDLYFKQPSLWRIGFAAPYGHFGPSEGKYLEAWLNYVEEAVERYKDKGNFWEIWNEPDGGFWAPYPNPVDYFKCASLTAKVIKEIDLNAIVGGPVTAGVNLPFVETCLKLGLGSYVDRVGFHPYRWMPEVGTMGYDTYEEEIGAFRNLVNGYNRSLELWDTEGGWSSAGDVSGGTGLRHASQYTELSQAKYLLRRFLLNISLNVEYTCWYKAVDSREHLAGLLDAELRPKSSYNALQNLCSIFNGNVMLGDLDVEALPQNIIVMSPKALAFTRTNKWRIVAYWLPYPARDDFPENRHVKANIRVATRMKDPMLVDMIEGTVREITHFIREGPKTTFKLLPLRDYPCLIAEREALNVG